MSGHRFLPLALPSVELGCRLRRPGRDSIPGIYTAPPAPSGCVPVRLVRQRLCRRLRDLAFGGLVVGVAVALVVGTLVGVGFLSSRSLRDRVGHGGGVWCGVCVCVCLCVWCALASVRLRVCETGGGSVSRAPDR